MDRDNDGAVDGAFYRHSRIKTYLNDGRALRVETVINDAYDIGVLRRLEHFGELTAKAGDVNRRMLQTMRAGPDCVLASPAIERIAHPSVNAEGRRTPALRVGDPRVMALAGALSLTLSGACGITDSNGGAQHVAKVQAWLASANSAPGPHLALDARPTGSPPDDRPPEF